MEELVGRSGKSLKVSCRPSLKKSVDVCAVRSVRPPGIKSCMRDT